MRLAGGDHLDDLPACVVAGALDSSLGRGGLRSAPPRVIGVGEGFLQWVGDGEQVAGRVVTQAGGLVQGVGLGQGQALAVVRGLGGAVQAVGDLDEVAAVVVVVGGGDGIGSFAVTCPSGAALELAPWVVGAEGGALLRSANGFDVPGFVALGVVAPGAGATQGVGVSCSAALAVVLAVLARSVGIDGLQGPSCSVVLDGGGQAPRVGQALLGGAVDASLGGCEAPCAVADDQAVFVIDLGALQSRGFLGVEGVLPAYPIPFDAVVGDSAGFVTIAGHARDLRGDDFGGAGAGGGRCGGAAAGGAACAHAGKAGAVGDQGRVAHVGELYGGA